MDFCYFFTRLFVGRSEVVIIGGLGFLAGVVAYENMWHGVGVFAVFAFCMWMMRYGKAAILLLIIFICMGFLYVTTYEFFALRGGHVRNFVQKGEMSEVENTGKTLREWVVRVSGEPDIRRTGQKLTARVEDANPLTSEKEPLRGKILLDLPKYPQYEYGDILRVSGVLIEASVTEDFSYKDYLRRYGVYGVMGKPRVELMESAPASNMFFRMIFRVKSVVQEKINVLWAEPFSSFISGLLLGSRRGIPEYLLEAFNVTGLTHIIAISGYNISLVILFAGVIFSGLGRKKRLVSAAAFVILFTIFVGMSAAVVRAAVMGTIGLLALYFGRSTYILSTLVLTALLMNMVNPQILLHDVGFQLSFSATCGIVFFNEFFQDYFQKWIEKKCKRPGSWLNPAWLNPVKEGLAMTCSAQVTTLPLILFYFGRMSLISPLANIVITPFVPLSMATGALAVLLDYFSHILALPFIGLTWLFLKIMTVLTLLFSRIPYAQVMYEGFDIVFLTIIYLLLWYWYISRLHGKEKCTENPRDSGSAVSSPGGISTTYDRV